MATTIESIHDELVHIRRDVEFIRSVVSEDFELSDEAKLALDKARRTPESEYIDLE
ncbi:MAG TPA: hypothetical protein VJI46_02480 [Candidatus Nanoarchaeia archaeon]|nr:hypothetical protein [Candidatus Nanoarchaeia archaeon]